VVLLQQQVQVVEAAAHGLKDPHGHGRLGAKLGK
jgi:hypothetical protein